MTDRDHNDLTQEAQLDYRQNLMTTRNVLGDIKADIDTIDRLTAAFGVRPNIQNIEDAARIDRMIRFVAEEVNLLASKARRTVES